MRPVTSLNDRQLIVIDQDLTQPLLGVVLNQFTLINSSDSQLTLHGSYQRRSLEQSARQCLQCLQTTRTRLSTAVWGEEFDL